MIDKEFIEEYSLFRKFKSAGVSTGLQDWKKTPINMDCQVCKSMQTFNLTTDFFFDGSTQKTNY